MNSSRATRSAPSVAWSAWYSAMKSAWLKAVGDFSSYTRSSNGEGRWLTLGLSSDAPWMLPVTGVGIGGGGGGGGVDLQPVSAAPTSNVHIAAMPAARRLGCQPQPARPL